MVALLLTFSLFIFLMFLGKAVLEIAGFRFPILRSWLLAPCVGLATVVLLTLNLNQTGLPVKSFGSWLTLALSLFVVAVFWWRRPVIPWKQLGIFVGLALLSLLYTCWPMFLYGFRWVGNVNADMGTYCLGALRALNFGFYRIPLYGELAGTDFSQYWWFHYGPGLYRCGSDIFLAWISSVTRLQPIQLSMPALGALSTAQLFTGASLILVRPWNRKLAITAGTFLALSPFFVLAVIVQVIAQVGGLTLMLGVCTLCMKSFPPGRGWRLLLKDALLIAWVGAACSIYYPEALPFAVLAIIGFQGYELVRRKQAIYPLAVSMASSTLLYVIIARQSLFTAVGAVLYTFGHYVHAGQVKVLERNFGTMMHPSLFASAFGFMIYYGAHSDPWMSLGIAAGILLLAVCVIAGVRGAFRAYPWAFLLLPLLAAGVQLFFSTSAFGLFKLVMYIQPVLFVPIAALALRLSGWRRYLVPLAYFAFTCNTAWLYTVRSTDLVPGAGFLLLPRIPDYDVIVPRIPRDDAMLVDSPNMLGDFIIGAAGIGTDMQFMDSDTLEYFINVYLISYRLLSIPPRLGLMKNYLPIAEKLRDRIDSLRSTERILGHTFITPAPRDKVAYLSHLALDPWHTCRNDANLPKSSDYFVVHKLQDVDNYLLLMSTSKGGPFYRQVEPSRWSPEDDFYRPGQTFYAIGRYLLYEVIRPTPNVRIRFALTRGLMGQSRTLLPASATVAGENTQTLRFTGNGAANVISEPVQLYWRDGRAYLAVDAGMPGDHFPDVRTGLMRLFNTRIPIDDREVVAFVRSIIPVTDNEYRSLVRPRSVASWPRDLLENPNLEFSGIYEDGWVSDNAYLILGKAARGEKLVISGIVPGFGALAKSGNGLEVQLNGKTIYRQYLSPGPFEIEHTLEEDASECRVSLKFRQMVNLPPDDNRPVAAQLHRISIVEAPSTQQDRSKSRTGEAFRDKRHNPVVAATQNPVSR